MLTQHIPSPNVHGWRVDQPSDDRNRRHRLPTTGESGKKGDTYRLKIDSGASEIVFDVKGHRGRRSTDSRVITLCASSLSTLKTYFIYERVVKTRKDEGHPVLCYGTGSKLVYVFLLWDSLPSSCPPFLGPRELMAYLGSMGGRICGWRPENLFSI